MPNRIIGTNIESIREASAATKAKLTDLVATRNDFPTASYSIDLNLEKLMYCAMILVRKTELEKNTIFNPDDLIVVGASNFAELTSSVFRNEVVTAADTREAIKIAETALYRVYQRFDNPVMLVRVDGSDDPAKVPMMTYCHYDKKNKNIKIRFAKEFYQYFYELVKKADGKTAAFSSHELKHIILFNSGYAMRIYRILISEIWRTEELSIGLDELKWVLQCSDKYSDLSNFKKRVLDIATDEINHLSNIEVAYENIKDGRDVVGIKFNFNFKSSHKLLETKKSIVKIKEKATKKGAEYKNDGSHFKAKDRCKYFKAPIRLSGKQISVLVNCPEFLNDYGVFIKNYEDEQAKVIMRNLLVNELDKLNRHKPIDLDFYFWLQAKKGLEIASKEYAKDLMSDIINEE